MPSSYSDDFQEILGQPPSLIIRSGMGAIFILLLILGVMSAFIRYPKTVNARVELTSQSPPIDVVARSTGKIQQLFIEKNQNVKPNAYLAVLENPADFKAVQKVKSLVENFKLAHKEQLFNFQFANLGSVEPVFQQLLKNMQEYENELRFDMQGNQIEALQEQIEYYKQLNTNLNKQNQLIQADLQLIQNQYSADSILHHKADGISKRDLEKSKSMLINKQQIYLQNESSIINNNLTIKNLEQEINSFDLQKQEAEQNYLDAIQKSRAELLTQIKDWEQKYVLKSPISGSVDFHDFRTENQEVNLGDIMFSVIPSDEKLYCKAEISSKDIGEVQVNQNALIQFDAFEVEAYGRIQAQLETISLVPKNDNYTITLKLVNGLETNYKRQLPYKPLMQGSAEIITKDLSILERIFFNMRELVTQPY